MTPAGDVPASLLPGHPPARLIFKKYRYERETSSQTPRGCPALSPLLRRPHWDQCSRRNRTPGEELQELLEMTTVLQRAWGFTAGLTSSCAVGPSRGFAQGLTEQLS